MSPQLMAMVRELKALNARKKAGEALTPDEEKRRAELKTFLKAQLEGAGGDDGASAAPAPATSSPPRPATSTPPAPATPPRPPAAPTSTAPPPRPTAARPVTMPESPPASSPGSAAKPFAPKKDAYAISGAMSFIEAAMNSEAVAKADGWSNRKATASAADVAEAEARADAAVRANNKRTRAVKPEEVEVQLKEVEAAYTPPEPDHLVLEQYYGDYFGEGLQLAPVVETGELKPIDPREIELRRALDVTAAPGAGATSATVPPGLAFLDDFSALYAKKVLPPPLVEAEEDVPDPTLLVGRRKVTVHMLNGERKQGSIRALRRGELGFKLETPALTEEIAIGQIKALFVHLQPNATPKGGAGRSLTVMFRDQRSVQGDSDDYAPGAPVFTLIPPAGRGQFEKIVINAGAVASVT